MDFPQTSNQIYISGILALNIPSEEGTGDWHMNEYFTHAFKERLYLFGEGQVINTNHIWGKKGISDQLSTLRKYNLINDVHKEKVFCASHPRACADLIYADVIKKGQLKTISLDEWFPNNKDKETVLEYFTDSQILNLTEIEQKRLKAWKALKQNQKE